MIKEKKISKGDAFIQKVKEADKAKAKALPEWEKRDISHRKRYGSWNPTRKLSRQQMNDIRELKMQAPQLKTVQIADHFQMNPESIRRILKSGWVPDDDELNTLRERAERRKARKAEARTVAQTEKGSQRGAAQNGAIGPPRYKRKGHQQKKHKPRSTKPYTEGIGDLIE